MLFLSDPSMKLFPLHSCSDYWSYWLSFLIIGLWDFFWVGSFLPFSVFLHLHSLPHPLHQSLGFTVAFQGQNQYSKPWPRSRHGRFFQPPFTSGGVPSQPLALNSGPHCGPYFARSTSTPILTLAWPPTQRPATPCTPFSWGSVLLLIHESSCITLFFLLLYFTWPCYVVGTEEMCQNVNLFSSKRGSLPQVSPLNPESLSDAIPPLPFRAKHFWILFLVHCKLGSAPPSHSFS